MEACTRTLEIQRLYIYPVFLFPHPINVPALRIPRGGGGGTLYKCQYGDVLLMRFFQQFWYIHGQHINISFFLLSISNFGILMVANCLSKFLKNFRDFGILLGCKFAHFCHPPPEYQVVCSWVLFENLYPTQCQGEYLPLQSLKVYYEFLFSFSIFLPYLAQSKC